MNHNYSHEMVQYCCDPKDLWSIYMEYWHDEAHQVWRAGLSTFQKKGFQKYSESSTRQDEDTDLLR